MLANYKTLDITSLFVDKSLTVKALKILLVLTSVYIGTLP